jgi:molecular chaperone DnaJ
MGRGVQDPYELLGVDRHATAAEIKAAFRRAAAQHHPDKNPTDPEAQARFQQLNEAHQILSDPQKRAAYDRYGPDAFRPGGVGPDFGLGALAGLDSLLHDLLGVVGIHTGRRGDLRQRLAVTFEQAARGCTQQLVYERIDLCERCNGSGGDPNSEIQVCPACGGSGRVRIQSGPFSLPLERDCARCRGSGQVARTRCSACRGRGLVRKPCTVQVQVPAGIAPGSSRTLPGRGSRPGPGRPPGDLEVVIDVQPHPFFRRQGDDVLCQVPISFTQATLGGEVDVPTLDGKVKLRIYPATQPGSVLRLRGKGIAHRLRGGRGDQLVEVNVQVPTELSERARQLIAELGQELGEAVPPEPEGLLDRFKRLFV